MKTKALCSVEGCESVVRNSGMCNMHLVRVRKHGDPNFVIRPKFIQAHCNAEGCDREHYGKGFCKLHYRRKFEGKNGIEPGKCLQCEHQLLKTDAKFCSTACSRKWNRRHGYLTEERRLESVGKCSVDGCNKAKHANGMCTMHNERVRKYGDPSVLKTRAAATHCKKCGAEKVKGLGGFDLCGRCYDNHYYHANNEIERIRRRVRNSYVKRATPKWADKKAIGAVYATCPKGYQVDHIVPLRSKKVCGLHVHWNLQHLPAIDNRRKLNKHEDGG